MAEILITGMDLSEDRQIIITKDGKVLATDWRGISMPTEATARELPPHGRLIDADFYKKYAVRVHNSEGKEYIPADYIDIVPTVLEATK